MLQAEARIAAGRGAEVSPNLLAAFQDFQRWLAAQGSPVVIVPFAAILAEKIPADETRMRRDFKQLIAVIKSIALLNQHHRRRDSEGWIAADLADYAWARRLLIGTFKSIVGGGITEAVRQTCEALPEGETSEADLARILSLSKDTVHYRVNRALRGGWLRNLETRKGYPFRLVRAVPLPADDSPLPTREEMESEFAGFEHPTLSNGHSNGPQHIGRVGRTGDRMESTNVNEAIIDAEEF